MRTRTEKIVTECIRPPIPVRRYDWIATREHSDLGDPIGYGATEAEVMADLVMQEGDIDERTTERTTS